MATSEWFKIHKLVFILGAVFAWGAYVHRELTATGAIGVRALLASWGLTPSAADCRLTLTWTAPVFAAAVAVMSHIGIAHADDAAVCPSWTDDSEGLFRNGWFHASTPQRTMHFYVLLAVYPVWGCIQQWLVLSVGARAIQQLLLDRFPSLSDVAGDRSQKSMDCTSEPARPSAVASTLPGAPSQRAIVATSLVVAILFGVVHALAEPSLMVACTAMGFASTWIFLRFSCLYPLGAVHGWCGTLFYFFVLRRDPLANF